MLDRRLSPSVGNLKSAINCVSYNVQASAVAFCLFAGPSGQGQPVSTGRLCKRRKTSAEHPSTEQLVLLLQTLLERGNSGNIMTSMKTMIETSPGFLTPIQFEQQVLKWQHTAQALKAATSKQRKTSAYPPAGVAWPAEG